MTQIFYNQPYMTEQERGEIIIYQDRGKKASLEVRLSNETVWLSLFQMTVLFGRDKSVISRHIKNIFKEHELSKNSVVAKSATTSLKRKSPVRTKPRRADFPFVI